MPRRSAIRSLIAVAVFSAELAGAWSIDPSNDWRWELRRASCGPGSAVALEPATPTRGTLFRVRLTGVPSNTQLSGEAAGERLRFAPDSVASTAFGAIAIDAADTAHIVVHCVIGGQTDSIVLRVATMAGNYPMERLTVAPAFGTPPDEPTAARIQRESQRALDVATRAHTTPRLWDAPFVRPRTSPITSGFGSGREYNGTITSRHMGTDFAGETGAHVVAVNGGVVRIVDAFYYGGNVIYIDHGAGLSSAYLHLSKQLVQAGDTVQRGQIIGHVGATGRVTGPHLHVIVSYGLVTVDPLSLFP